MTLQALAAFGADNVPDDASKANLVMKGKATYKAYIALPFVQHCSLDGDDDKRQRPPREIALISNSVQGESVVKAFNDVSTHMDAVIPDVQAMLVKDRSALSSFRMRVAVHVWFSSPCSGSVCRVGASCLHYVAHFVCGWVCVYVFVCV